VDVKTIETDELWDQSLRLTEITRKLKVEANNAAHFVVFDACRNTAEAQEGGFARAKGFVPVTQESGLLIAYATAEAELASDVGRSRSGATSAYPLLWSSARVMYKGEPTGTGAEDNARAILEQAERVSKFGRTQSRTSTLGPWTPRANSRARSQNLGGRSRSTRGLRPFVSSLAKTATQSCPEPHYCPLPGTYTPRQQGAL